MARAPGRNRGGQKGRWRGILFDFRTLPLAGATWVMPKDMRSYRGKKFLVVLAGPAVNLGMIVLVLVMLGGKVRTVDFDSFPQWARLFIIANLLVLIGNLWPYQPKSGFGVATDGKQLLQLISFSKTSASAACIAQCQTMLTHG